MSYRYQTYWHLKDLKAAHQSFWGPGPLLKATTWAFIDGTPHPLVISPGKLRYVSITIMWCPKKLQVDFKTFFDYKKVYLPYTNILRFQSGAPPAGIIHACPWWACRITSLYKWCQKTRTIAQLGGSRNCGKKKVMDGLFHGKSQSHSWMIAWGCLGYGTPPILGNLQLYHKPLHLSTDQAYYPVPMRRSRPMPSHCVDLLERWGPHRKREFSKFPKKNSLLVMYI